MGSPLSPVLAVVICVYYERIFFAEPGRDKRLWMKRYVDDVWAVAKYRKGNEKERNAASMEFIKLRSTCYHERMEMETEGEKEEVRFLETRIEKGGRGWRCVYESKNEERERGGKKKLKRFTEYESYGDRRKVGMVIGAYTRVEQNCSDGIGKLEKSTYITEELVRAGYPKSVIIKGLDRMARKTGDPWRQAKWLAEI